MTHICTDRVVKDVSQVQYHPKIALLLSVHHRCSPCMVQHFSHPISQNCFHMALLSMALHYFIGAARPHYVKTWAVFYMSDEDTFYMRTSKIAHNLACMSAGGEAGHTWLDIHREWVKPLFQEEFKITPLRSPDANIQSREIIHILVTSSGNNKKKLKALSILSEMDFGHLHGSTT